MARQITAPVGPNAKGGNNPTDVVTVQELLNNVPPSEGGPEPELKIDGICGNKTGAAIQKFQLKQFGWSGADGRVDPLKQTLAKLNKYDKVAAPLATQFRICRNWDMPIISNSNETWFSYFQIVDVVGGATAVYYFGDRATARQKPSAFAGRSLSFSTSQPYAVTGLECPATYTTYYFTGIESRNVLTLQLKPKSVLIESFPSQLFLPGYGPQAKTQDMSGDFILVP